MQFHPDSKAYILPHRRGVLSLQIASLPPKLPQTHTRTGLARRVTNGANSRLGAPKHFESVFGYK
jgi:hypothetical protein